MVLIRPRSAWGARHQDGDLNLSGLAVEVFIHHSVTAQLSPNASEADEAAQMRNIESIGQNRFRTGISYNVIVFPSGRAWQGVSFHRRGTHTGGRNSTVRSICFAGNYENAHPTNAQLETARQIIAEGRGRWWTNGAPVRPHSSVSSTACPGRNVRARLGELTGPPITPAPVPPAPTPEPEPEPEPEEKEIIDMGVMFRSPEGAVVYVQGGRAVAVRGGADFAAYQEAGIPLINLSAAGFNDVKSTFR